MTTEEKLKELVSTKAQDIKVVGLQRSGTNYLTELLKANFEANVYDDPLQPFFKHAFPKQTRIQLNSGVIYDTPMYPKDYTEVKVVFVHKKFRHWFKSIERFEADLKIKQPSLYNREGELCRSKAEQLHDSFYNAWTQYADVVVPYESLIKDLTGTLDDIAMVLGIKPKHDTYIDVETVPHSPNFKPEDKQKYLS